MNKLLLSALLFLAIPTTAIAENLPTNYMIVRGKTYNLNYLWGKGVIPIAPITTTQSQLLSQPNPNPQTESREVRDNKQRVLFENARSQIMIEYLQNQR